MYNLQLLIYQLSMKEIVKPSTIRLDKKSIKEFCGSFCLKAVLKRINF